MCAIVGSIITGITESGRRHLDYQLRQIWLRSHERGRDGRGYYIIGDKETYSLVKNVSKGVPNEDQDFPTSGQNERITLIGNVRAEPTTEWVKDKTVIDQQPYTVKRSKWTIVHNGTIANDKQLREGGTDNPFHYPSGIDSSVIAEQLAMYEAFDEHETKYDLFNHMVQELKGSYAILATNDDMPGRIYFACNYRPIWYTLVGGGMHIGSSREYLPGKPIMVPPYTCGVFNENGIAFSTSLYKTVEQDKALVICSGGLDSVVAATQLVRSLGKESVELIHFKYGSRAEGPEIIALRKVADRLGVKATIKDLPVYSVEDSNLLNPDATVAGGEAGAEYAHEWVPARNLLLIAVATAYAEAKGFTILALGNNLEEAGAYPDNEPEFITRIGDLLPFAVGDGVNLKIIQPVGNLMKHEIVALGVQLKAPLDVTWSCYRNGTLHCGKCGPCFMRKTAFEINDEVDPMVYEKEL